MSSFNKKEVKKTHTLQKKINNQLNLKLKNKDISYPIFFINLERAKDRLIHITNELNKFNLTGVRYVGNDGKNLTM